jgi:DNA-directed RNA polymerase subunit beta
MAELAKKERVNFGTAKNLLAYPDFLDVQLKSFQNFFQLETTADSRETEGLFKVFSENFPITDSRNNFVLEFWIISLIPLVTILKKPSKEG